MILRFVWYQAFQGLYLQFHVFHEEQILKGDSLARGAVFESLDGRQKHDHGCLATNDHCVLVNFNHVQVGLVLVEFFGHLESGRIDDSKAVAKGGQLRLPHLRQQATRISSLAL